MPRRKAAGKQPASQNPSPSVTKPDQDVAQPKAAETTEETALQEDRAGHAITVVTLQVFSIAGALWIAPDVLGIARPSRRIDFLAPLIAQPVPVLWQLCSALFVSQITVGIHLRRWRTGVKRPSAQSVLRAIGVTLAAVPLVYSVIVLFGAAVFSCVLRFRSNPDARSRFQHTLVLATLVSILAFLPAGVALDLDWDHWTRLFSGIDPKAGYERVLVVQYLGATIGCWLGAVPIPLDWDRPWQAWPITCAVGALIGHQISGIGLLLYDLAA